MKIKFALKYIIGQDAKSEKSKKCFYMFCRQEATERKTENVSNSFSGQKTKRRKCQEK